jgi:hypothetical protein
VLRRKAVGREQCPHAGDLRQLLRHHPVREERARRVSAAVQVEQHSVGLEAWRDDPLRGDATCHDRLDTRSARQANCPYHPVHAPPAHLRGQRRVGHVAKDEARHYPPDAALQPRACRRDKRRHVSALCAHVDSFLPR